MYYALQTSDSEEHSHSHTCYLIASNQKVILESLVSDIEKVNPNVCCNILEINSESLKYLHTSDSDYSYGWTEEDNLGETEKELERIYKRKSKEYPSDNISINEVECVCTLSDEKRFSLLKEFTFDDPKVFLEGYERKKKAKETGEYYSSPSDYDEYQGVWIHMKDDVPMPWLNK